MSTSSWSSESPSLLAFSTRGFRFHPCGGKILSRYLTRQAPKARQPIAAGLLTRTGTSELQPPRGQLKVYRPATHRGHRSSPGGRAHRCCVLGLRVDRDRRDRQHRPRQRVHDGVEESGLPLRAGRFRLRLWLVLFLEASPCRLFQDRWRLVRGFGANATD